MIVLLWSLCSLVFCILPQCLSFHGCHYSHVLHHFCNLSLPIIAIFGNNMSLPKMAETGCKSDASSLVLGTWPKKRVCSNLFWFYAKHSTLCPIGSCWTNLNQSIGLSEYLIKWICSNLSNREQQVVLNGQESTATCLIRSTPRISVGSATLFDLYSMSTIWQMVLFLMVVLCISVPIICFCIRYFLAQTIMTLLYSQT